MSSPVITKEVEIGTAQLGIPLPIAYGFNRVRGNEILRHELVDKRIVSFRVLGEDEWDGMDRLFVNRKLVDHTDNTKYHFHPGIDGPLGFGLGAVSNGGDQKVDSFYSLLPTGVQKLTYSRKAYIAVLVDPDPGAPTAELDIVGDYRCRKVRIFDAAGAQTSYAFSTNPAWQMLDLWTKFYLKREALVNEALTADEKTRINFPSFVDAAAYFDALVGGKKRFEASWAITTAVSLTAAFEQALLMCRSYMLEIDGTIFLYPDKARASTFTLTAEHFKAGTLEVSERSLSGAANHLLAHFNDLEIPPLAKITATGASRTSNVTTITTVTEHGLKVDDTAVVREVTDASFNSESAKVTTVPSTTSFTFAQVAANATSGNGFVGRPENRFITKSPVRDHEEHQSYVGQRGLGLSVMPRQIPLEIDYGNNTAERTARLLYFQTERHLGPDVTPYVAPRDLTLKAWKYSVDNLDRALLAQLAGDVITIDKSVTEEYAGEYEILERVSPKVGVAQDEEDLLIALTLKQYISSAFTDIVPTVSVSMATNMGTGLIPIAIVDTGGTQHLKPLRFTSANVGKKAAAQVLASGATNVDTGAYQAVGTNTIDIPAGVNSLLLSLAIAQSGAGAIGIGGGPNVKVTIGAASAERTGIGTVTISGLAAGAGQTLTIYVKTAAGTKDTVDGSCSVDIVTPFASGSVN